MKTSLLTVFVLASLPPLSAVPASAQGRGGQPRLVLQALDADHDGKLSAPEIQAAPQTLLTLDRNGDGQLTADELQPRPDNTGASPDELVKQLMSFDKNGDGEITPDEMRPRQQTPQERLDHLLDEWDTNKDGKLTKAELPDRMQQQFDSLDKNKDGVLDRDELLQYFAAMDAAPRGQGAQPDVPMGRPPQQPPE